MDWADASRILKWEFTTATEDDWGLNESRGAACEFVAWQFLCHLNQRETIEFLLEELPLPRRNSTNTIETDTVNSDLASPQGDSRQTDSETTPLLPYSSSFYGLFGGKRTTETQLSGHSQETHRHEEVYATQRYSQFFGLNALEIATIAHAKRFLSQLVVQRVVDGIWKGEIVFWDSLTVNSTKKPHIFNTRLDLEKRGYSQHADKLQLELQTRIHAYEYLCTVRSSKQHSSCLSFFSTMRCLWRGSKRPSASLRR